MKKLIWWAMQLTPQWGRYSKVEGEINMVKETAWFTWLWKQALK